MPEPSLFDDGHFAPCPAPFNMAAHTLAAAARTPEKVALEVLAAPGRVAARYRFAEVAALVRAAAGGLAARGLGRGDRLALRLGNTADFPVLFFAANALGAVPVPLSAQLTAPEVATILADLGPALIAADPELPLPPAPGAPVLGPAEIAALRAHPPADFASTAPDDPAYMVYTSGTSGRPKGVLHAQRAAWARRMMWDGWYGLTPDDRVLHAGAFNWTFTLGAGLTDPWAIGATALIYSGPRDRAVWPRLAAAHGATIFAAAPGVYRQMLDAPDLGPSFAGLRHGLSAGEALAMPVRQAWSAATGRPIHEALGMSEVSTYVSSAPAHPCLEGATGFPQPGRRVAVLPDEGADPVPRGTEGLLAVSRRDPGLMLGYWNRPEETASAFRGEWFVTGDRAVMRADGAIVARGRADDLLNAGGYRVSPAEIEAVLLDHPGVAEAAAVELPLRPGVSIVAAYFVPTGPAPAEADLAAHCAARLARYKCPRSFRAVPSLPRGANGKLLRRRLKETAAP
jgi:acyl-coenzyme A synthetase/AMP-(fatty) acid ligase